MHRVSKYLGSDQPKIADLGSSTWQTRYKKARADAKAIAQELLAIHARRALRAGYCFPPYDDELGDFRAQFEYIYTDDQLQSIEEIYSDMKSNTPMNRLLCGDVGFGKTEVAFHAIYHCILSGKQAILLAPLAILSYEHYEKAQERFATSGINIALVNRFESKQSVHKTLEQFTQ